MDAEDGFRREISDDLPQAGPVPPAGTPVPRGVYWQAAGRLLRQLTHRLWLCPFLLLLPAACVVLARSIREGGPLPGLLTLAAILFALAILYLAGRSLYLYGRQMAPLRRGLRLSVGPREAGSWQVKERRQVALRVLIAMLLTALVAALGLCLHLS